MASAALLSSLSHDHIPVLSSPSFNNTEGFWTCMYFQTSLAICVLICFREIGPQGWSETSKEYLRCVALALFTGIREKGPCFQGGCAEWGITEEVLTTGWFYAHMSTSLSASIADLQGVWKASKVATIIQKETVDKLCPSCVKKTINF